MKAVRVHGRDEAVDKIETGDPVLAQLGEILEVDRHTLTGNRLEARRKSAVLTVHGAQELTGELPDRELTADRDRLTVESRH